MRFRRNMFVLFLAILMFLIPCSEIFAISDRYNSDRNSNDVWGIWYSYKDVNGNVFYENIKVCGTITDKYHACFYLMSDDGAGTVTYGYFDDVYSTGRDAGYTLYYQEGLYFFNVNQYDTSKSLCNVPVFKEKQDALNYYSTGIIDDLTKLDMRYGFSFDENGNASEQHEDVYEEEIGYPLNFEFHNYYWAFSKDRWCTWSTGDFDVNEDLRCEIYYNCQLSQYYELFSEPVYFTVPKRALSFSDNSASSCLSNYKTMTDMCTEQILPYLREHNDTEYDIDGGLTGVLKLRRFQNLEVWARFYYIDACDNKHYGNWVKWTTEGVKVLKDKSQLSDEEEEDNAEAAEKKTFTEDYVKTDDGVDPDKTSDTEDIEGVPTTIEQNSTDGGSSSGSSTGSSSDNDFSISGILEFLGKLLSGLAEFLLGAIKAFLTFISDLLSGLVEIVESVSDVSSVFGILLGWLPLNLQVVLSIAIAVAIFLRVLRR